ncbi:MAG: hypothetical protein Q4G35_03305 [Propionibacteriaceae bacterium]|nr:hypothetical protein [Propionibacteriaceae bacterium]
MEIDTSIKRLENARFGLEAATAERVAAVESAREAGKTWREIAAALDMTERGVTKLIERANAQ